MSSTFELRMLPSADVCMSSFPGLLHGPTSSQLRSINGSRLLLRHAKQAIYEIGWKLSCHLVNKRRDWDARKSGWQMRRWHLPRQSSRMVC
jgi:hypothetical protein